MFVLQVDCSQPEFFSYLKKNSTFHEPNVFAFTSSTVAADIIAHFLFYYLKKNRITLTIKQISLKEPDISYFKRFISLKQSKKIISSIYLTLSHYFTESAFFSLEGFLHFRLKKQTAEIENLLDEALSFYQAHIPDSESIHLFQEMINFQQCVEKELSLIVENKQLVWVKGKQQVYFTETTEEEDKLIMHCILMAPRHLHVLDQHHFLSHKTIVLLKKIFREKVTFDETDYFTYSN